MINAFFVKKSKHHRKDLKVATNSQILKRKAQFTGDIS